MSTLNSNPIRTVSPSFGEGPTQRLIETVFPEVKKKREKLQTGITSEGKDATSFVTSILAHHIDPEAELNEKPAKKVIVIEKPVITEKSVDNKTNLSPSTTAKTGLTDTNTQPANITPATYNLPIIATEAKAPLKKVAFNGNEGKALNIFA